MILAASFVPLGHLVGRTLEGERPLLRYGLNILGSLIGIGGFVLLSAAVAPPWLWMLMAALLSCASLAPTRTQLGWRVVGAMTVAAVTLVAWHATTNTI